VVGLSPGGRRVGFETDQKREWRVVGLERATLLTYVKWVAKTRREGNQEAEEEEMKGMKELNQRRSGQDVQDARHAVPVTAAVWAPIVDLATNMRSCLLELCSARHFEIGTLNKADERVCYMRS
jgi:thioredoxin-like negative regulator of GroEL